MVARIKKLGNRRKWIEYLYEPYIYNHCLTSVIYHTDQAPDNPD